MFRIAAGTYAKAEIAESKGPGFDQSNSIDGGLSFTDIANPGTGAKSRAWRTEVAVDFDEAAVGDGRSRLSSRLAERPAVEALMGVLAPARITNPTYGTRCSTACIVDADGRAAYAERAFDAEGREGETARFEFRLAA